MERRFGVLVMLASELKYKGFFNWTAEHLERMAGGLPTSAAFAFVVVFFYYVHYGFASVPRIELGEINRF